MFTLFNKEIKFTNVEQRLHNSLLSTSCGPQLDEMSQTKKWIQQQLQHSQQLWSSQICLQLERSCRTAISHRRFLVTPQWQRSILKQIPIKAQNIQTLLASVHLWNDQTFGILADMTQKLQQLWYSIALMRKLRMSMWGLCSIGFYKHQHRLEHRLHWFPRFWHYYWHTTEIYTHKKKNVDVKKKLNDAHKLILLTISSTVILAALQR